MAKLFVRVIRAHHLPPSDTFNQSDPYVEVDVYGQSKKTPIIKSTLNPIWDETLMFNMKGLTLQNLYPSIINTTTLFVQNQHSKKSNTIEFTIFDHDRMSKNEKIGKCFLPLSCVYDGCPVEYEDESGSGPPWWLYLAETESIVQDYNNLVKIPPPPQLRQAMRAEIVNFPVGDEEEIGMHSPSLQSLSASLEDLTETKYKEENWANLWQSYNYKQAMYDQKKKPQYLELEIQLEHQFIENRFLDKTFTKPLLMVEALLTNVSIGKEGLAKKSGPSAVQTINMSSSVGNSTTIPAGGMSPHAQEGKHLPRLTFSRLARSFKLQNHNLSTSPPVVETKPETILK